MHLTMWQLHGMGMMFPYWKESSASEESEGIEVYGQQLDESKEDKSEVSDVEDSLVTEGEHNNVEDKTEMGDVEDTNNLTQAEGGKVAEAVHNKAKRWEE